MNARIVRRQWTLPLLGSIALALVAASAGATVVQDSGAEAMAHRYGRAGIIAGNAAVERPDRWLNDGDPVGVKYDAQFAERTNMPRSARHEGPVTDRTVPFTASSHG